MIDNLEGRFWKYHDENPAIYEAFDRFAMEAFAAGRTYIGAKMLFERIRWYTTVEARGEGIKLNNNYHAFYARLWMIRNPGHRGFLRTRKQREKGNGQHD